MSSKLCGCIIVDEVMEQLENVRTLCALPHVFCQCVETMLSYVRVGIYMVILLVLFYLSSTMLVPLKLSMFVVIDKRREGNMTDRMMWSISRIMAKSEGW